MSERTCFNAMLFLLMTHSTWRSLPPKLGSAKTVRRRIREWERTCLLDRLWRDYLDLLSWRQLRDIGFALGYDKRRPIWLWPLETIYRVEYMHRSPFKVTVPSAIDWEDG